MDTRTMLDHQLAAFSAGDADANLQDFVDDAVLGTADGVVRGRAAIHAANAERYAALFRPGTYAFTMLGEHVAGK
jgi:hypothetical protein